MRLAYLHRLVVVLWFAATLHGECRLIIQSAPALDPYQIQWAAGDSLLVSKSRRGEIRVWKPGSGALLQVLPPVDPMGASISVSPDGSMIAGIRNGRAVVMDRLTGKNIWEDPDSVAVSIARLEPPFLTIASAEFVKRVDFSKQAMTHRWDVENEKSVRHIGCLNGGAIAIFLHDRTAVVLNKEFKETGRIISNETGPYYFGLAAGDTLALATFSGVFIANSKGEEKLWRKATPSAAAFGFGLSPDGKEFAVGSMNGTTTIRSSEDLRELWRAPFGNRINSIVWSTDQSTLAFATESEGLVMFDMKSRAKLPSFGSAKGIDPLDVTERVFFDARAQWFGILRKDIGFVHALLGKGNVSIIDPKQAVQPATRLQSESVHDLILSKHLLRFQSDGRLIEKFPTPSRDVFDSGSCGVDGVYYRDNAQVYIYRTTGGKTTKEGMFPLGVGLGCCFSADGRIAIHDAPADKPDYIVRKSPTWEVLTVIPMQPGDDGLRAVWLAPDGQSITWMGHSGMYRHELKTGQQTVLIPNLNSGNSIGPGAHVSAPDWFLVFSNFANPVSYRIHSASDGSVVYESKPWRFFADELDLQVIGVSSNKRGLWMCGSGSRPVLVDLKTGQPVLRLHVFEDSTHLWETPDAKVAGSPKAKSRCFFISEDGMNATHDPNLLDWELEAVESVLRAYSE